MTEQEILEYNKRCAEFLGMHISVDPADGYDTGTWYKPSDIEGEVIPSPVLFHSDWNWIMEVVEAIEKELDGSRPFKYGKLDSLDFIITNKKIKINASFWTNPYTVNGNYWSYFKYNKKFNNLSKKEAVVEAINQFLIWYNNEKTN